MADDPDWANISREEASGSHTDHVLLLLGPEAIPYELPLSDIPENSDLLVQRGRLPPQERRICLPLLEVDMMEAYIDMDAYIDVRRAAAERSWVDVTNLAITAEVLQDSDMRLRTIAALKEKAKYMTASRGQVLMEAGYQNARDYNAATGGGLQLLELLDSVKQDPRKLNGQDQVETAAKVEASRARVGDFKESKYANSALRNRVLATTKLEEDEKWYPVRQPKVPPGIEALRTGTGENFEW